MQNEEQIQAAERLAAIVESSDDAIISKNLKGIIQSWNQAAERIFGFTAAEAIGQSITIVIPAEFRDQEPDILARIGRGERIDRFETIRQRKDGTRFHVSLTISPVRDDRGRIVGASKIARDISDLRQSQERQEILLREMNHRVKNLFAVASGVVALSSRSAGDAKELGRTIQARLAALARAHELILPHAGAPAATGLKELVKTLLSPYETDGQAITTEGPSVSCGPNTSNSLALLLHEFATNSVKYGALANGSGTVDIAWSVSCEELILVWTELSAHNNAEVPASTGFGSFLVDATTRALGAQVRRDWSDGRLRIELRVPLPKIAD
jgi:PAS domain S-box-containing protein